MIKENEIRIGNYLRHPSGFVEVENIGETGINVMTQRYGPSPDYDFDDLEGILLDNELLEKCGFRKGERDGEECLELKYHNSIKTIFFVFFITSSFKAVGTFVDRDMIGTNIYYLHQLQNLYFALAGEELNFNL